MAMYRNEPFSCANFTEEEKQLIWGGEATMWTEQVDDVNFDSRVFPRILAAAERLWSDERVNLVDGITWNRLDNIRCQLLRRGIRGGPVAPGYCDFAYPMRGR